LEAKADAALRRTLLTQLLCLMFAAGALPAALVAGAWALSGAASPLPWAALGVALGLALALSALLAPRFLRPLHELSASALQLTSGRLGVQAKLPADGELGRLAGVFNYMSQQLLANEGETRRLYENLEEGYLQTMLALTSVIDSKDRYTSGHSQRVGEQAAAIGRELGLTAHEVRHLLYAGVLHDVGKIGIGETILCKREKLTEQEMATMRGHPVIGAQIISGVAFLRPVVPAVRHHHERWDGSGYPDGLVGEQIPLIARIVGAADVWDACTSKRTYQEAMAAEAALELMDRLRGTSLDPVVVDALERVVRRRMESGERVTAAEPAAAPATSGS